MRNTLNNLTRCFGFSLLLGLTPLVATVNAESKSPAQAPAADTQEKGNPTVIMKINGQPVTQGDLDKMVDRMVSRQSQGGMMMPGAQDNSTTQTAQMREAMKSQAQEQLIGSTLIEQAVEKEAPKVSEQAVKAELAKIDKELAKEGHSLKEMIAQQPGLTEAEVQKQIRQQIAARLVVEREVGSVDPTDEEIKKTFEEHKDKMGQPEMFRASHVLIGFNKEKMGQPDYKPTDAEKAAAKKKAEEVYKKAKAGEDFAKLAKEYSDDKGSGAQGGDLDFFPAERMVPEFSKATAALKDGEISQPVETQFGFHIIKRTGHKAAKTATFDEMKDQIREVLRMQNMRMKMPMAVAKLRAQANVVDAKGNAIKAEEAPMMPGAKAPAAADQKTTQPAKK